MPQFAAAALDAAPASAPPAQSAVETAQSAGYCARLRWACGYKDYRGEQSNCSRYRAECGGR